MIATQEHETVHKAEDSSKVKRAFIAVDLQDAHLSAVYAYISRRLRSREDAEDVTSETFAVAFRDFQKVRGDIRLWLYGIARRKIADLLRKKSRSAQKLDESLASSRNHHEELERKETAEVLRSLVEQLPSDQREALMLQHLERLSVAQIAIVMKRSKVSVKGLLSRARENLEKTGKTYFTEMR